MRVNRLDNLARPLPGQIGIRVTQLNDHALLKVAHPLMDGLKNE